MKHASVFSGIGGPEVAATMLGWENLFHCEINPFCRAVLQYWYPNSKSYEDITKTDFTEWKGRIDVITGGFPCQPFSNAGKRGGAQDDRYLWPHMHRCIDEVQPRWVVAENVAGILSMVEQGEVSKVASAPTLFDQDNAFRGQFRLRETFTLERICHDLEADGYSIQTVLIPACAVGAPHRRNRVFIIGHRNEAPVDTNGDRGREVDEYLEPELADGKEPERNGRKRDVADTAHQRTGRLRVESKAKRPEMRYVVFGNGSRLRCAPDKLGARWQGFPTVAPVYGGGYGLPFHVDNLTISFSKWKNESIKAYGNAIVPQVMYEIFRAIEQVELVTK